MAILRYKFGLILIGSIILSTAQAQSLVSQSNDPLVRQYYFHFKHPVKASALAFFRSGAGYFYAGNIKRGLLIGTITTGCGIVALRELYASIPFLSNDDVGDEKLANTMLVTIAGLKFLEAFDAARIAGKYNAELAERIFGEPIEIRHNYILVIDGKEVY